MELTSRVASLPEIPANNSSWKTDNGNPHKNYRNHKLAVMLVSGLALAPYVPDAIHLIKQTAQKTYSTLELTTNQGIESYISNMRAQSQCYSIWCSNSSNR